MVMVVEVNIMMLLVMMGVMKMSMAFVLVVWMMRMIRR